MVSWVDSTVNKFWPFIPFVEAELKPETTFPTLIPPFVSGEKNYYRQQTHITRAMENKPILLPDELGPPPFKASGYPRSRTKLTSVGSCSRILFA